MAIPIIDDILQLFQGFAQFIGHLPKPLTILFVMMISGWIMGIVVPNIYRATTEYKCVDNNIYTDASECSSPFSFIGIDYPCNDAKCSFMIKAYNSNCENKSIKWYQKIDFFYDNPEDFKLVDDKGNSFLGQDICAYDIGYWIPQYCHLIKVESKKMFISPICLREKVRPSLFGNDIFNTKNFMVLMLLFYIVGLVFYLKK